MLDEKARHTSSAQNVYPRAEKRMPSKYIM